MCRLTPYVEYRSAWRVCASLGRLLHRARRYEPPGSGDSAVWTLARDCREWLAVTSAAVTAVRSLADDEQPSFVLRVDLAVRSDGQRRVRSPEREIEKDSRLQRPP